MLSRLHLVKLARMEESFLYFDQMRMKMQVDSQIKIAYCWRHYQRGLRLKAEAEKAE